MLNLDSMKMTNLFKVFSKVLLIVKMIEYLIQSFDLCHLIFKNIEENKISVASIKNKLIIYFYIYTRFPRKNVCLS